MSQPPKIPQTNAVTNEQIQDEPSQLDLMAERFAPVLRHVTMHRFLWVFILVCAFITWNRGLMLLYVLVAFLLAVLLVSYIYRFFNLRNIQYSRELPNLVTANEAFHASYKLETSGHKHFLEITETFQRMNQANDLETFSNQDELTQLLFFIHINRETTVSFEKKISYRGVYLSNKISLSCAYPLGLLPKQKQQSIPTQKLYVLPQRFSITQLDAILSQTTDVGAVVSQQQGYGDDITGLRQYRRGDQFKHIHWSATARQMSKGQEWLSKQYDSQSRPFLLVLINQFQCRGQAFETMLSIASSFAYFMSEKGLPCILMGVETKSDATLERMQFLEKWFIDVPALDKHLDHNLMKLAKLDWLVNQNFSKTLTGLNSYSDLVSQGMSQFPQANTLVTFSPFELPLITECTHINIQFSTYARPTKLQNGNRFDYKFDPYTPLSKVAALFNNADVNQGSAP